MGKLVRDKIPDIIRASGRTPRVTTLTSRDFRIALKDKLNEEIAELVAASNTDAVVEEAADVIEVLIALAGEWGVSFDNILKAAQRKRTERGGFGGRLWVVRFD